MVTALRRTALVRIAESGIGRDAFDDIVGELYESLLAIDAPVEVVKPCAGRLDVP